MSDIIYTPPASSGGTTINPTNNFLPDIGKLKTYRIPSGPGVRVDDSFEEGMDIPIYYDPMIAKLITWGENREQSIQRMIRAIDEYIIVGCETTLPFGKFVMQHEAFVSGNFDTHFVSKYFTPEYLLMHEDEDEAMIAALIAAAFMESKNGNNKSIDINPVLSQWKKNRKE